MEAAVNTQRISICAAQTLNALTSGRGGKGKIELLRAFRESLKYGRSARFSIVLEKMLKTCSSPPVLQTKKRKKYTGVLRKFDGFFKVRRNIIFERARFNRRNQLEGKLVEQYITALYSLAEIL